MDISKYKQYNRSNIDSARIMRKNPTLAEDKMRHEILKYRPGGCKFTRQKPLGSFIVDFYSSTLCLAIELDGEIHKSNKEYDKERTNFLSKKGIQVMRFRNGEIMKNPDKVYKRILNYIKEFSMKSPC